MIRVAEAAASRIRAADGISTEDLAEAAGLRPDAVYVALWRCGRSLGVAMSAVKGWVAHDDRDISAVHDVHGPPCPEPTPEQLERSGYY